VARLFVEQDAEGEHIYVWVLTNDGKTFAVFVGGDVPGHEKSIIGPEEITNSNLKEV
jgi:hypothetical protein